MAATSNLLKLKIRSLIVKRRLMTKLMGLAFIMGGLAFQGTGCNALTGDQFVTLVNNGTQSFFNSLFVQFASEKVDGLFGLH